MPLPLDVGVRAGFMYLVLVLALPLQYYISNQGSIPIGQRDANFRRMINSFYKFKHKYFSLPSWKSWCLNWWEKVGTWRNGKTFVNWGGSDDDVGESPAWNVIKYDNPNGFFAKSTEIRSVRPDNVKFRVGQVVRHKLWGYRGVIIGWDATAKAPEGWLNKMHPPDKSHWRKMPNYSILVDTRDRSRQAQATYVPQENLEAITQTEIQHPLLWDYFDAFDGAQYIMRLAIQYFYPKD